MRRRVDKVMRAAAAPSDDAGWSVDRTDDAITATVAAVESAIAGGAAPVA